MRRRFTSVCLAVVLLGIVSPGVDAQETQRGWAFKRTWEGPRLTKTPFGMMVAADLNRNGRNELVATDFGRFADHAGEWRQFGPVFSLWIWEWDRGELRLNWSKRWDWSNVHTDAARDDYFSSYRAQQMVAWLIGDKTIVETIPPYFGIEWKDKKYVLNEQQERRSVGSWTFPWMGSSCEIGARVPRIKEPLECLLGIRDFFKTGKPQIVTVHEVQVGEKQYKQTLRVRSFEPGFPIKWEKPIPLTIFWWSPGGRFPMDRLRSTASGGLLVAASKSGTKFLFASTQDAGFELKPTQVGSLGLDLYDLPDAYVRTTRSKNMEEYWAYRMEDLSTRSRSNFRLHLQRVTPKPDLSGVEREQIDFPHHDQFLSVGYFDLQDVDDDGLDEVILLEETGKKHLPGEEGFAYTDTKDYIHILRWNGRVYEEMWVSPPYPKRGTRFLIEDIKNAGRKQLVVLTGHGTIEIWDRQ